MLSVLIPTYNYNVSTLVGVLHKQLSLQTTPFEILIFEDGSTHHLNTIDLSNTFVITNPTNIGRVRARNELANKAKYSWLLFLDADVMPKNESFITNYLKTTSTNYKAIYGGFAYKKQAPNRNKTLRWTYGKTKEEKPAKLRNQKAYKIIISANYLIKKETFKLINSKINEAKGYGFDYYFGAFLKTNNINVLHIDNEVYHLGLDENEVYLNKVEQAVNTLLRFYKKNKALDTDNDLLKLFVTLNKYKLVRIFSKIHAVFKEKMKANLLSNKPSIKLLQFYRISYMCYQYVNEKT